MKKIVIVLCLLCAVAFAQSSGNFAAKVGTAACEINNVTGSITGGMTNTLLETSIKTPNSSSTALVIRPSLFTGLYTKTRVDNLNESTTSVAGIKVRVQLCDEAGLICKVVAPGVDPGGWVYYDKRFQQLSSNVPSFLGADCNPDPNIVEPCYIQLILSTLAAHSADFVIGDVGGGTHKVRVEWAFETVGAPGDAGACVGPGVLTVQQVKTFSTGGGIVIE
ncbi:MAG: hypothetical protein AAB403_05965 [Planctomycetota bacterium]